MPELYTSTMTSTMTRHTYVPDGQTDEVAC